MSRSFLHRPGRGACVAGWLLLLAWTAGGVATANDGPIQAGIVLRHGRLVDGTGAPERRADVALKGDRIVGVGPDLAVAPGAREIDVNGLVIAPGFIDLHSHSDGPILRPETRANRNYLAQGVTTVVTGNCGSGPVDTAAYFRAIRGQGAGTNIIHLIPQGALRSQVVGNDDVRATPAQLRRMERLVSQQMEAGAWGLSSGLIYVPSQYASRAELTALMKVVARHGGIYASHIRNEGDRLLEAIDEAIAIGRDSGAPVQISHLKAAGRRNWGKARQALDRIEAARARGLRVTADQYPYVASSTSLGAMLLPDAVQAVTGAPFARIAADPGRGPALRQAIDRALALRDGGASVRIARYGPKPERVGKSLAEIATAEGTSATDVVLDIQGHGGAAAISFGMSEEDVRLILRQPYVATASDGSAHAPGGGDRPHPRAYGTFPRKIRYALDDHVLSLEQAIHAATGLPASILGLAERGTIRVGAVADLLVFDPATFRDTATFDDPTQLAPGVRHLFINGQTVIEDGAFSGTLAGRVLTPTTDGPADLIVTAGSIWTGNPAQPRAEALAVRRGQIVAVGPREQIEPLRGGRTQVLDRPEGLVVPGLIDAHGHLSSLGSQAEQLDLRALTSPGAVAQAVRARLRAQPGEGGIGGRGWDQSLWPGQVFPTAAVLDAVAPDRPVWLRRVDGHAAWANTAALKRAGIDRDTADPPGGQIVRDSQGNPTGVLVDAAMELVDRVIPPPTEADRVRWILAAQAQCLAAGLTGVHDAGLDRASVETFRTLDRQGKLKLRVHGMASPPSGEEVAFVSQPPIPRKPGRRFELRAIKLFADGALGSRGALLFEPYADEPARRGLPLIDEPLLRQTTEAALRHGWQVCVHAIGGRANAVVLDAFAAARAAVPGALDPRLRIEHAQVVRRADVMRFRDLGVIASMQPSHVATDQRWADLSTATCSPGRRPRSGPPGSPRRSSRARSCTAGPPIERRARRGLRGRRALRKASQIGRGPDFDRTPTSDNESYGLLGAQDVEDRPRSRSGPVPGLVGLIRDAAWLRVRASRRAASRSARWSSRAGHARPRRRRPGRSPARCCSGSGRPAWASGA